MVDSEPPLAYQKCCKDPHGGPRNPCCRGGGGIWHTPALPGATLAWPQIKNWMHGWGYSRQLWSQITFVDLITQRFHALMFWVLVCTLVWFVVRQETQTQHLVVEAQTCHWCWPFSKTTSFMYLHVFINYRLWIYIFKTQKCEKICLYYEYWSWELVLTKKYNNLLHQ